MEVVHDTPFVGHCDSVLDKDGSIARVAVLKATFSIAADGALSAADEQEPIRHAPLYVGEPGCSSVLHESDGAYFKPATDIILVGTAYAPRGRPVTRIEATLSVAGVTKTVAVVGDRRWSWSRLLGATASPAASFVEMPICWERAYGGADQHSPDPARHRWEKRNPVGTGFRITDSAEALDGLALPNFEDPRHPMTHWKQRLVPQGFGALDRWWQGRIEHAGTYDDAWQRTRMPILPVDFDYRFFQAAAPDLRTGRHLQGGEVVAAENLSKRGLERFVLPRVRVSFVGVARGRRIAAPGVLDTVVCLFDRSKVVLVWRAKYATAINDPTDPVTATVEYAN